MSRDPADIIDRDSGKVRVLAEKCSTCVFRPGNLMRLDDGRLKQLVDGNLASGALLTCHQTLPYSDNPGFDPAACAGFWERYGMKTGAGRIAQRIIGVIRISPPAKTEGEGES